FGAAMGLAPGFTILIILPAFLHTSGLYIASSVDSLQHVLGEYGLVRPVSVDADGRFLTHAVSAGLVGAGQSRRRWRREAGENKGEGERGEEREGMYEEKDGGPLHRQLYYNVTVFGREFHLRLRHNARLVAPGAKMEWHNDDDSNGTATRSEPLQRDCFYVGDVTDTPGATVAISNCDGLTFSTVHLYGAQTFTTLHIYWAQTFSTVHLYGAQTFSTVHLYGAQNFTTLHLYSRQTFSTVHLYGAQTFTTLYHYGAQTFSTVRLYGAQTFSTVRLYEAQTFYTVHHYGAQTFSTVHHYGAQTFSTVHLRRQNTWPAETCITHTPGHSWEASSPQLELAADMPPAVETGWIALLMNAIKSAEGE
ncbi:unnamed protein product, partial [Coregonus sp. 'balchen']